METKPGDVIYVELKSGRQLMVHVHEPHDCVKIDSTWVEWMQQGMHAEPVRGYDVYIAKDGTVTPKKGYTLHVDGSWYRDWKHLEEFWADRMNDPIAHVVKDGARFKLFTLKFSERLVDLATTPGLMDDKDTALLSSWVDRPFSVKLFPARYLTDAYAASMQDATPLHADAELYLNTGDRIFEDYGWWATSKAAIRSAMDTSEEETKLYFISVKTGPATSTNSSFDAPSDEKAREIAEEIKNEYRQPEFVPSIVHLTCEDGRRII